MKKMFFGFAFLLIGMTLFAQGPWNNPLLIRYSTDGILFSEPALFVDSAGVPSAVKWKGDTLICVFQWFPNPVGGPGWDSIAVKFSYDNGMNWTAPTQVEMPSLPTGYQRPFDPTLAVLPNGQLRVYFSSSESPMMGGLDSTVNTYSAISSDGIHFTFEPGARFDHPTNRCIDPAVIRFNTLWHYTCPIGAPQDGAYHATGPDGLLFFQAPDIGSDATHNWTGNFCIVDSTELRFYGSGQPLWYNATPNGGTWNGFVNTNITMGGDPTVVKTGDSSYLIIYVGDSTTTIGMEEQKERALRVFPNPFTDVLSIHFTEEVCLIRLQDLAGRLCRSYEPEAGTRAYTMEVGSLPKGAYILSCFTKEGIYDRQVVIK